MNAVYRSYGPLLGTIILLGVAVWTLAMIVGPQLFMIEQSLWRMEQPDSAVVAGMRIEELNNALSLAQYDLGALDGATDPGKVAERETLARSISTMEQELATLQGQDTAPVKVYTINNYTEMSGYHAEIFVKTIGASLLVTLIAFAVCYPVAYAAAKLAKPQRAALILLGLVIPYAINELLRVFAWLMILDYQGVANSVLLWFGLPEAVRFLDSGLGVFVAMVYAYVLFMVFPIYNTIETLDTNQIEAARDLGASTWKIHTRVVLPHAKPGIAVGSIMTFMLSAGSFSVPHIMTRGTAQPWFSQLIYSKFYDSFYWNQGAAYAFTLLLVCVAFIILMMKVFKVGIRDIAK